MENVNPFILYIKYIRVKMTFRCRGEFNISRPKSLSVGTIRYKMSIDGEVTYNSF